MEQHNPHGGSERVLSIAVVGGGNGSYTMAADMALAGHRVRMWPGSERKHADLFLAGAIEITGLGRQGRAALELVTSDPGEAVDGAELIFCSDPAFSQEARAHLLAPHLKDGQVVFLSPGSLGSLVFDQIVRREGGASGVVYAEPGTLPYLTRKIGTTAVQVSALAVHLPVGVYPAEHTEQAVSLIRQVYPGASPVENVLSVALLNVGPIIHSVLVILNTGAIEHFESWDIHNEGTTPAVKRLILQHDSERLAVREAFGFTTPDYPVADHYQPELDREWMYGRAGHTDLVKSERWREKLGYSHRYIAEDVKYNLALLVSLGDLVGIDTAIADSLLTLASRMAGEDFRRTGRTLDTLGIQDLSVAELLTMLQKGLSGASGSQ